jgi:cobalt/nickel transport system permease protein
MATTIVLRTPLSISVVFAGTHILGVAGRIPAKRLWLRLGLLSLVLFPFAALLPFFQGGAAPWWVLVSEFYLKALALVTLALIIVETAPLDTTLKAAHALGIPSLPLHLLMMAYRYIFVLSQELNRMRIAIRVRGFRPKLSSHTYETTAHVAGTLFVRGYERAETVGQAMRCRGFAGKFHSLAQFSTRLADIVFFALILASCAILCLWDYLQF